jgi:hypothetical protein
MNYRLIEDRGEHLTQIELNDVAEINLNSLVLIGRKCINLQSFSIIFCHFQV